MGVGLASGGIYDATRHFLNATATPPNLLLTPGIDAEIEQWRATGVPPFPELALCPRNDWHRFSKSTLRLIYHIAGLSIDLHRRGLGDTTVWSANMPRLLAIAVMSDYVMSSILALSALHMAYVTGSKETLNLSHHHRNIASKGLQDALGAFSREGCDAILAASLVLSWQAVDWTSISTLQKGILFVLDSMHPSWKESSEIAQILENQRALRIRGLTADPNSSPNGTLQIGNIDSTIADLHRSQERLQHIPEFYDTITELIGFMKQVRSEIPFQSPKISFARLQSLRAWILWLPTKLLRGGEGDLGALAVLAHFYSAALVLEPFFPGLEGSYLGCMTLNLVENVDVILQARQSRFQTSHIAQLATALMDGLRHSVNEYKTPIQWTPPLQTHSMNHILPNPPSPYHQFDEYPSTSFVTSAPYTPTTISSFAHAVTSPPPPLLSSHAYKSSDSFSSFYISPTVPSSEYYDDSLSDYSRPGTIEHSPAFSSYGNDYIHGLPTTEHAGSFNPNISHDASVSGSNSVPPELWT
ncbi:C6 transcription factor RosA-like, putative [Talaromyces stipitatus ATCC 10500]|uniref:C6 transcription factor RosA-like, putative n=1 Tax=Talaromyces stipitatus (strain ATCC 10500 / CBS 375.48 / QM 6759 / NRRL 1006) TaxID=441959 RepID=B8M204_TALSN|nr:C6 transcription factor RosA-like, putative [Talaromyces stipitatus ATCC 10500]EED21382.1 C6 transcription factor RosA-like, putative [Talaromyces stipitatus ATCC 10500]